MRLCLSGECIHPTRHQIRDRLSKLQPFKEDLHDRGDRCCQEHPDDPPDHPEEYSGDQDGDRVQVK